MPYRSWVHLSLGLTLPDAQWTRLRVRTLPDSQWTEPMVICPQVPPRSDPRQE